VNDRFESEHVSTIDTARGVGHIIGIVVMVALVVALLLLALDNTEDVRVGYVVGDADAPLWTIVVAAAVAGVIIGWLIRHRRRSG
jgi:uncharacterized integral membrane protein